MSELAILTLAVGLDLLLGEPPSVVHPVVWAGKLIARLEGLVPKEGKRRQFCYGSGMVLIGIAAFALPTWFLLSYLARMNVLAYVLVGTLLLKPTFALRGLWEAAEGVRRSLAREEMGEVRARLKSLVSRDVSTLSAPLMVAAAVESTAENMCDSFVAPLFYYLCFGVPGALAYRVLNTFDSMMGYHGSYEYLGKAAAKLDDLANLIPARLTALLIVVASYLTGAHGRQAWGTMLRYHGRTESPNAGWTMSAMAGALQVQLEKVGHYRLGEPREPLSANKIAQGIRLAQMTAFLAFFSAMGMGVVRYVRLS